MRTMETSKRDAIAMFTDEAIDAILTRELHELAVELLDEYQYREVVIRITMTKEFYSQHGAMTASDAFLTTMAKYYVKRDPQRVNYYGEMQLTVWAPDDSIRSAMKYRAERARKDIETELVSKEEENTD